jgi:hypothetical protein
VQHKKKENPKSIILKTCLLFAVCTGFGFSSFPGLKFREPKEREAYVDVVSQGDVFIAIKKGGQIDWISEEGVVFQTRKLEKNLTKIIANDQQLVVSGDQCLLFREKGNTNFQKMDLGRSFTINCLTLFNNMIIAGSDKGELRIGNPENQVESVLLNVKGNIVSLSSGNSNCYGVTDRGEIIHSIDGKNWDILDFNKTYDGFYEKCNFKKVLVTPKQIALIGQNEDDSPALYFSSKGNVWTKRHLNYEEDGNYRAIKSIPTDIYYDSYNDQHLLLFTNGKVMGIPSCSHCNKLYDLSENTLHGISGNEHAIIIVGDNNYIKTIKVEFL